MHGPETVTAIELAELVAPDNIQHLLRRDPSLHRSRSDVRRNLGHLWHGNDPCQNAMESV